jgi:ABC-type glycerol-3-phosphate transport system permease component
MRTLRTRQVGPHGMLWLILAVTLVPFFLMLSFSLKNEAQFQHEMLTFSWPPAWQNYVAGWTATRGYFLNSLWVTLVSTLGLVFVSSSAAFAFARYRFPGRNLVFGLFMLLLMIPGVLTLIPAFAVVRRLGLAGTSWGLILPYIGWGQAFAIFVLRGFFESLPRDLFEAAQLDGAGDFRMYWDVALPLCMPPLATVGLLHVLNVWNDYVWPSMVLTDNRDYTIAVGLRTFTGQYYSNYGPMMAGYVIASLPLILLFLFTMRAFIRGLSSGALKM